MSLSAYLAKNYLTASTSDPTDPDSARPKKRRKKDKHAASTGLIIAYDDEDLQLSSLHSKAREDADADRPVFDTTVRSAEFRKAKKNNWNTLSDSNNAATSTGTTTQQTQSAGQDEADRILASAARESEAARREMEMEDAPTVAGIVEDEAGPKMASGARAGLQTAAETAALELEESRRRVREAKAAKMQKRGGADASPLPEEQTVYRDATGRRIDVSMKRAEARAAEAAKIAAEKKEREDAMGEVQQAQKEERALALADAKFLSVARGADDEDMNDELRRELRWDDPMAAYMMQKEREEEGRGSRGKAKGKEKAGDASSTNGPARARRREYAGAAPPNRYGIKPGWRWDGVDRGNGFEKEWFQARGRKSRNENLEYQWQMDE